MRKIAMRCTQEQFESIKDRIEYKELGSFTKYPYLTNNSTSLKTGTITNTNILIECEIYETFNAEIFLKACDSWEDEKTFKFNELQCFNNLTNEWIDCSGNLIYRFKKQPDYTKEIEALQLKAKENGMKCIINFEKI